MQRRLWRWVAVMAAGGFGILSALGQGTLTLVTLARPDGPAGRLCDVELTGPGFRWDVRVANPASGQWEEVEAVNGAGPTSPVRRMAAVTGQGAAVIRTVAVPFLAPGSPARVEARVWDFTTGDTFETARIKGTRTWEVRALGGVGQPPSLPARLELNRDRYEGSCWDPPAVRGISGDQVRHVGESFALTVSPTEVHAATRYQWRRDGGVLTNGLGAVLRLESVQPAQAGVYDVVVSVGARSVTSPPVRVGVVAAPRLEVASAGGEPLRLRIRGATNRWYAVEQERAGGPGVWQAWTNVLVSQPMLEIPVPAEAIRSGVFRVRVVAAP
ncbi:MAG: immunoglobulin domain-containing protein [Verrucomicrobiota bacterium]